jgi:cytochrome c-type biogenesis protein CcmH
VIAFSLAATALALLVLLIVVRPLLRAAPPPPSRESFDRAVYRDQLAELVREEARGLIAPAEAAAARLEIQRRLLRAEAETLPPRSGRNPALALVLVLLAASAAGGIYIATGAPDLPAQPFASRPEDPEQAVLRRGLAELDRRLAADPRDGQAWLLLGRTRSALGQWGAADQAFRRALALLPATPELRAIALEAAVLAADGIVGEAALRGFAEVLAEEPDNPIARYYLAQADAQAGRHAAAIAAWLALAADMPAEAPIRAEIARRIAAAARAAGTPAPPLPPPATPQDPEARDAMVRGMVERLATRLEGAPDDAEGWARLGRAYAVLGERGKSADAYARAGALRPDDMEIALAEALVLLEGQPPSAPFPPRALALLTRVIAAEPRQPVALWHLGVEAAKRGAMAEAGGFWDRLLAILPPDSEDARLVRGALAAVRR